MPILIGILAAGGILGTAALLGAFRRGAPREPAQRQVLPKSESVLPAVLPPGAFTFEPFQPEPTTAPTPKESAETGAEIVRLIPPDGSAIGFVEVDVLRTFDEELAREVADALVSEGVPTGLDLMTSSAGREFFVWVDPENQQFARDLMKLILDTKIAEQPTFEFGFGNGGPEVGGEPLPGIPEQDIFV